MRGRRTPHYHAGLLSGQDGRKGWTSTPPYSFRQAQGRQAGLLVPLLSETTFQNNPGLGFNALLPYAQTLRDKIIAYYAGRLFA